MTRLDIERQNTLNPIRMDVAKKKITEFGFKITFENETQINFEFMGHKVYFFPYSGWHSGASIKDGRGLQKLLNQLKINKPKK